MILANSSLSWCHQLWSKVMLQIVASLTIVIDDRNRFIIQATDDKKNNSPNFLKNSQKSH